MQKFMFGWPRAIVLAVCAMALTALSASAALAQQSGDRFQGILTVVWGDPHKSVQVDVPPRFTITYPDRTRVQLDVGPELQGIATQHAGKRVTVRGTASAESGAARIKVESIEAPEAGPRTEVTGTRKVLFILLKFKSDTQTPHPPAFFTKLTNPMTPSAGIPATINAFFDKVSYGKFKWQGKVAGNKWYTLSMTRAQYCGAANCGPNGAGFASKLDMLGDEAVSLVAGDVSVNDYDNINFVFNNDLDCCAWGGSYSNGMKSFGATWEPPWGQETGVYVHEMGHSLGLPHSGWKYSAYDSQHDQMSNGVAASSMNCGSYNSVNFGGPSTLSCDEPGGGFIMAHQDYLGWIPALNKRNHSTVSAKIYNIEANSVARTNKIKLVTICIMGEPCTGASARFLTVEVKLRAGQFDNGVPSEGVVIHDVKMNRGPISGACYFNDQSGWAVPYDAVTGDWNSTTCTGMGLANMAYGTGKTFNNPALGIKVKVGAKTGNSYRVTVTKSK